MKYSAMMALLMLSLDANAKGFFAGYDLGEMAFNDFKKFSGEFGYEFENGRMLKFVYMNVIASEKHLSSDFAQAVEGENVAGVFKGHEIFYTFPIKRGWYWGMSAGYYEEKYQHTKLNESVSSESFTLGLSLGYRENNVFGYDRLYYDFSIPFRYSFNGFEETKLGESTVTSNKFRNNIWLNIGVKF